MHRPGKPALGIGVEDFHSLAIGGGEDISGVVGRSISCPWRGVDAMDSMGSWSSATAAIVPITAALPPMSIFIVLGRRRLQAHAARV